MKEEFLTSAFTRARERLMTVARRFSAGDTTEADDLLQEAFVRLWSSAVQPKNEAEAEALGRTVIRNLAIDSQRRLTTRRPVSLDDSPTLQTIPEDDSRHELESTYASVTALIDKSLTDRDREIIYLRDRDGWEMDEIAERFGLSEANVRVILSRARRTIRQLYLQHNRKS